MPVTERGMRKSMLSIFSVLIFLFAFSVNTSQAQSIQFVDPATAIVILKAEANKLEIELISLPQSDPTFEEKSNKQIYYGTVVGYLNESYSVEQSIFDGYAAALGSLPGLVNLTSADVYQGYLSNTGLPAPTADVDQNSWVPASQINNVYMSSIIDLLRL